MNSHPATVIECEMGGRCFIIPYFTTEDGGQGKTEVRCRMSDVRSQMSEDISADYPDEIEKQKAFHRAGADCADYKKQFLIFNETETDFL